MIGAGGDEIDTASGNGHGEPVEEGDRKVAVASAHGNGHGERDDPSEEPPPQAEASGGNGHGEDDLPAPSEDS